MQFHRLWKADGGFILRIMSFNIRSQVILNMWPLSLSFGIVLIMKSGDICEMR